MLPHGHAAEQSQGETLGARRVDQPQALADHLVTNAPSPGATGVGSRAMPPCHHPKRATNYGSAGSIVGGDGHRSNDVGEVRMAAEPQWRCRTDAESRRPVFVAALLIIAGQAWVAHSLVLRPVWVFPAISTALLVASIAVYERSETPGVVAAVLSRRSSSCW